MRRRSERKKSTDVSQSPPPVIKRPRRSRRSSQVEKNKTEIENGQNEMVREDSTILSSVPESRDNGELIEKESSLPSPKEETKGDSLKDERLETIAEVPIKNENEIRKDNCEEAIPKEIESYESQAFEEDSSKENNISEEGTTTKASPEESNDVLHKEIEISKTDVQSPTIDVALNMYDVEKNNKGGEVSENSKETELEQEKNKSPDKTETSTTVCEAKKTFSRNKERRTQIILRKKEQQENDENDEFNNISENISTPSIEKKKSTRKRRWLSKRTSDSSSQILAISTDSLKNLISDVHPVPLCDVKLESSSEVEEIESEREEGEASPTPIKSRTEKSSVFDRENVRKIYDNPIRKISLLSDRDDHLPPIPTKNETSSILYITNLVRPFTVLQLKGLLARTGKIVENRFWIDKIKSKCFIQYETEDEAVETRHALHGVRWPTSNPKCLNVDFGTAADMEKAMASSQDSGPQFGQEIGRENRIVGTGWDRDRFDFEEKKIKIQVGRPVREWDVGKREELEIEAERARKREKMRVGERGERVIHNDRADKESIRIDERSERERDRKRRSSDRERRRSLSVSPARKIKKKSSDPPLRLLDDLFRKTKTTPCIYWLPLTPEQIAEKEAFRLRRVAEHQERMRQRELEKEKDRERERERDREREKERRRERDRSNGHRRTNSRDRRRY